ncbi:MAG: hypothetical protein IKP32_01080 [Clostridia bacterium]|nr:hypothetical protein [Clostridia bacterium]
MKKRLLCAALALILMLPLTPGALAVSSLDVYATGSFNQSYPVYSGPGLNYYRANNGKATYGGGAARIFGVDGDWLMMGYQLSNGDYRIGYIEKDALNHLNYVNGVINGRLVFSNITAYANDDSCYVTDDPIINCKDFYKVPRGQSFTVLGTLGENFTYVEVLNGNILMRGFIWNGHIRYNPGEGPAIPSPVIEEPLILQPTAAPVTYPPATYPPVTYPPATYPPATYRPVTYPPTYPPVTYRPVTYPPTYPPVTAAPTYPAYVPNTFYHDTTKGSWLPSYQRITIQGNWPVYSGPGEYYYRGANGRALMGGGTCVLFGIENNWALIGYGLTNGGFRIGYVSISALPMQGLRIPYLDLVYSTKQLVSPANLTDDILRTMPTVVTLPAGTYVLFLGYIYESYTTWAYVEVLANNTIMRGFVPAYAVGM